MFTINSRNGDVNVYAESVEETAVAQIMQMANSPLGGGAHIRIMPDCHAGAGCTIGTTMHITDKVCPNLVGVDIGCGMFVSRLEMTDEIKNNFQNFLRELDQTITRCVPSGMSVNDRPRKEAFLYEDRLKDLRCRNYVNTEYAMLSVGTLGGGNHFLELNQTKDGGYLLVVHSGSRHLGKEVAEYYQAQAVKQMGSRSTECATLIEKLKAEGRQKEIADALKEIKKDSPKFPKELAYCKGRLFDDYIHDMEIVQEFATVNRRAIVREIMERWQGEGKAPVFTEWFTTIHNYIDTKNMILRKGAVAAEEGQVLLIPMNMRDGSLLCRGKGNPEWNCSAPHGAGRLMSRSKAKQSVPLNEFRKSMEGIYTTSVGESTLDESPQAYKPADEIIRCVGDTVEILETIRPVYNFKAH